MVDPDPKPSPPEKPLPGDCCESGCDTCVFTVYSEELEEYAQRLAAWRERHPGEERTDD
ncbi:MAG TPA: oxidoreductase-like domain-containing protein [Rhodanobacteraceae bacterium]|nr:oxidoreductase-like domain-containing protein [Rhodanobacteraceae bacterium]